MAEKRSLYIKQVVDGTEGVPFPSEGAQAVIGTFTYEATRMGTAPTIEATLEYPRCLDGEWHKKVYVEFRGEKYYVLQVPTSKKENGSHLYSHDVTFVSQRICLENVYFYDVVSPLSEPNETDAATCYRSNSSSLTFYGDISEFVGRLNDSLIYSGLAEYDEDAGEITGGYYVVIDDGITSETVLVSFEDKYIAEALQEIYNTYELSYYFVGKVCHVGYSENVITTPLEYRAGLLTIERENTGEKAINKVTGTGGSDNIPYYYPNGDSVGTAEYTTTNFSSDLVESVDMNVVLGYDSGAYSDTLTLCKNNCASSEVDVLGLLPLMIDGVEADTYRYATVSVNYTYDTLETLYNTPYGASAEFVYTIWGVKGTYIDFSGLDILYQVQGVTSITLHSKAIGIYVKEVNGEGTYQIVDSGGVFNFTCDGIAYIKVAYTMTFYFPSGTADGTTASIDITPSGAMNVGMSMGTGYFFEYSGGTVSYADSGIVINSISSVPCKEYNYEFGLYAFSDSSDTQYYGWEKSVDSTTVSGAGTISITGMSYVPYASTLMPSVYRNSLGTERYYKAYNNTYTDADGNYVEFANEYDADDPREAIVSFDDIHPTIKGVTNSSGQLFGEIADIAFDNNDNDLLVSGDSDSESEYVHSYFYIKLHKFDGDFGFNLFEQATEDDTAKVCLTSGNCSACEFEIGVYKRESGTGNYVFDNPVQVDSNGDIVAGDYIVGSVYEKVCQENGNYQDSQQDTTANEVWIALKKENSTFGVVMPNATNNYRPSVGDTFVITGIKMPQSLVEAAEAELDSELIAYMKENNEEKFTYNITLSRIWLARNEDIADLLNENARLTIVYNDIEHQLYVSNYTCKADDNILYEVTVELAEEITVATSTLTQQLGEVESHVLSTVSSADFISSALKYFLRKDTSDTASGLVTFLKGLKVGTFVSGSSGAYIDSDGNTEVESLLVRAAAEIKGALSTTSITNSGDIVTENLTVTGKATFFELVIDKIKAAGGAVLFTPADGFEVEEVDYDEGSNAYTLRWQATDGEKSITNMWVAGDQAICQTFNAAEGTTYNVSNKLWWALVTAAGRVIDDDGVIWNYIVVDFDDVSDNTGDSVPEVGDAVAMLGSRSEDTARQSAVYISAYASLDSGLTAPLIATYRGIDDYDLESHRYFKSDAVGVTIKGELISMSGGNEYPVKVSMGEWDEDTTYSYYNEVTYEGGTYLCISHDGCQGVEPGTDGAVWLCTAESDPVYMDVLVDGVSMNYMEMAYGESIAIECKLMRGWKEYSGSVDSWSITRDSGDEADDAAWLLLDKVQNFDGSITLCYGPDENDLPSDTAKVSATFTVTASSGSAAIATVEITI